MMLVENVIRTEQDRRHLRSYLTSILADGGKLGKRRGTSSVMQRRTTPVPFRDTPAAASTPTLASARNTS